MTLVKAGVVGLGKIGFEFSMESRNQPASHLGCYHALDRVSQIGVCDTDKFKLMAVRRENFDRLSYFTNYHEMMQELKPNIVSICTPTPTHKRIACDVASYPCVKKIFLEKPIAQSLKEAYEITDTCRRNGVELAVNYGRRWSQIYNEILKQLYRGDMGKLTSIIGLHDGPLLRTGSHILDLFNMLNMKRPTTVQAFGGYWDNYLTGDGECNDYNINGCVTYSDTVTATLFSGMCRPYLLFEIDIFTTTNRIRVTDKRVFIHYQNDFRLERYVPVELGFRANPTAYTEHVLII